MATRVLILGTGLIGASLGLALKALGPGFEGVVAGWDADPMELAQALAMGAIDQALPNREAILEPEYLADVYVLATPVLPILDWMRRLAPVLPASALVTDVGSTKREIVRLAKTLYNGPGQPGFLPSHPMAGKEAGGAAPAEASLFQGAAWLFTPVAAQETELARQWRRWIQAIGAKTRDIGEEEHDRICAWVSHLPQMLSTALAALLETKFADDPVGKALVESVGGRALRETTRLGASPYSMWRDIALTNTEAIADTLWALEQELAYLRENLRTPELRTAFEEANQFRRWQGARAAKVTT